MPDTIGGIVSGTMEFVLELDDISDMLRSLPCVESE